MTRSSSLALALSLLVALPGSLAASREVWRFPDAASKFTGPAVIDGEPAALEKLKAGLRRKERRQADVPPQLEATVRDGSGQPVEGVAVLLTLRGSSKEKRATWEGATDRDGRFTFRPAPVEAVTRVALDFTWARGSKIVRVELEHDDGRWRMDEAPYRNAMSGDQEGSCENLFTVTPLDGRAGGVERVAIALHLPDTLLECERVEYGADRKSEELARVDRIGQRDVNDGDRNYFGRSDEEKMGLEAAAKLDSELELLNDPVITGYVQGVLQRVIAASDQPDMAVKLRIVHTEDVNAFVTAGGNVYVFTGLIAAAENESQLAGVLAHESSHAIARHVTEGATRQMKTQAGTLVGALLAGKLGGLGTSETETLMKGSMLVAGVAGMKYDRQAESEADLLGAQYLWRAGWDPEAIARFFARLDESGGSAPPAWLSTHPSHEKRVENGLHWSRAFLPERERYLVSTGEFQEVQARVRALPPPRKRPATAEGQSVADLLSSTSAYQQVVARETAGLLGQAPQGR